MNLHPKFRTALLYLWVIAAVVIVALGLLPPNFAPPEAYHLDKLVHGGVFGGMMLVAGYMLRDTKQRIWAALFLITVGVGLEILQTIAPNRDGTIGDALADTAGILIALLVARKWFSKNH